MLHDFERRASPRLTVIPSRTYVEIIDWTGKRITKARLLNVSTTGRLVVAYNLVPRPI